MRSTQFNPRQYQSKPRVYSAISGRPGVSKLWIWNPSVGEYQAPSRGKSYLARKKVLIGNKRVTTSQFFDSLEQALCWQVEREGGGVLQDRNPSDSPLFREVLHGWKIKVMAKLGQGTQIRYQDMLNKYFTNLLDVRMSEFNSEIVDRWIEYLLSTFRTSRRIAFKHELDLLSGILRFYDERTNNFVMPIKRRHRKEIRISEPKMKNKDLTETEFYQFREALLKLKDGKILSVMVTVQYFHALRISEVAALSWESVKFDFDNPERSRLLINRSIKWPRKGGMSPVIENNFKNSKVNNGVKEHPLFPESYKALLDIYSAGKKGLIFLQESGEIFGYRSIQQRFNTAFKNAGLDYSATHVMRHGGCRNIYNRFPDLAVAKQHLGNSDIKSVMVYAQRSTEALNEVAKELWQKR